MDWGGRRRKGRIQVVHIAGPVSRTIWMVNLPIIRIRKFESELMTSYPSLGRHCAQKEDDDGIDYDQVPYLLLAVCIAAKERNL